MTEIIGEKPTMHCNCCGTDFKYSGVDIEYEKEWYWAGFFNIGWDAKFIRTVKCPGCGKYIRLTK